MSSPTKDFEQGIDKPSSQDLLNVTAIEAIELELEERAASCQCV